MVSHVLAMSYSNATARTHLDYSSVCFRDNSKLMASDGHHVVIKPTMVLVFN